MPAAPVQRAGVGISGIENPSGGVWITEVAAGSAAARAGLQENDVVLQVGQYAVQTADDLARAVRAYAPGSQVVIKYRYLGTWVRTTKLTVP
jgi:putative serine protease PepD